MTIEVIPGLKELWTETLGHPDICIAILDGPVDQTHPSLQSARLNRIETLVSGSPDQRPATQHGTHVTSIVFGQHDGPVKGIAPHCRGLIVPIFKDGSDGSIAPCSQLDLARAIHQAVEAGANVINISGGELTPSGEAHPILAEAVQACVDRNVLIVAATGNEGCECLHVPGALPSVLAVGAMADKGTPLDFSNWGEKYSMQGILAPGENILGASPGGGTDIQSGTSYATPIVSGIAGLILSLQLKLGREPDPQAVRVAILESAYACDPKAISDCRPFMVGSLNVPEAQRVITKERNGASVAQMTTASGLKALPSDIQASLNEKDTMLNKGDVAPNFSVKDHSGREVRLSDYRGKYVVLWFYPQADTPG
jgi:cyanobactin maturation PatA/PatG family protease